LTVLDRMNVAADVVTYNTILRSLCDSGKLKQAMEVLNRQLQKECYPDVITYTILIEATCRESGVGQAMKLLDEMRTRGCKPDVVTYNVLVNGICKEGRLDEAIKFLDSMPSYGCQPNVITHNIILRSMCSTGRWMDAEILLSNMVQKGCSPSVVTFNILINFLCRKGLLGRAIDVLEKMPKHGCTPNSLSYNPLLHGFCKEKRMDRAIEYLEIMVSRGCFPDIVTYNTLLTALCKDGKVDAAVEILNQLSSKGCSPVLITYNTVIDGLSKVGKTEQAIELLDEMRKKGLKPDIITYSSLVGGLSREGKVDEAIKFFYDLERWGVRPNAITYNSILVGFCKVRQTDRGQTVHAHIIKSGTHKDVVVMTSLINVYVKCGTIEDARKVFDKLRGRNSIGWTIMITGHVNNSLPELAVRVFQEMLEAGAYPTNYTLAIVLNACSSMNSIKLGGQIHGYIIKYKIDYDASIGNTLCSLYSKFGKLEYSVKAFQAIREKNVISWTAIISACGDNGEAAKGLKFFFEMLCEDVEPNAYTLTSVLSLCCTMPSLCIGAQIHSLSIKLGLQMNIPLRNSIMYLYLNCGWVDEAQKLFNGMEAVSLVAWNAMIARHAQMIDMENDDLSAYHRGNEALNIFLNLNSSGKKPDLYTFSSILTVCSRLVALEQGEQIHAQALKSGYLSDVVVGTSLVNMYNKCGSIGAASKAFVEMSTRTMISWTSMITGFAQHGLTQEALNLFEDMRLAGVRPNQITFVGVLYACSHAGMVDESLSYFTMMQKEYKIKPVMDHFLCLIDMFVRLGRLDEAFEVIKEMDFEPNDVIWSNLIAGCTSQGNTDLGLYAAEQLLKLKPKDTETYVMLLNTFISAERWKDVSLVRELMKEVKVDKLKDWSWISIKDKLCSFKPSDRLHSHSAEIYMLEKLLEEAKSLGYEPLESLEVIYEEDEETKTFSSTVYHSEKLAIAFGLLNTPNAAAIRVIKSVSMCSVCHNFIKLMSSLTHRKIIVRDSKRLHKFVNGQCSCGD
ncbi:PPR domain-containing protein/PPR_1 domain-containing protein/PPR_2 domain-containing protein/DYW_deaminase domain-containing protein, partial [Cephalotus follicularis]